MVLTSTSEGQNRGAKRSCQWDYEYPSPYFSAKLRGWDHSFEALNLVAEAESFNYSGIIIMLEAICIK